VRSVGFLVQAGKVTPTLVLVGRATPVLVLGLQVGEAPDVVEKHVVTSPW